MSSVNSSYSSSSRITGFYSELDTDALVESLTSNQQTKIDKQGQNKTTYEWQNEALNGVIDTIEEFSNTYCSVLGTSSMMKSSAYSTFNITSSNTSNAATLSASSSDSVGNISIKILQLAENANVSSSTGVSSNGIEISSSNTATLAELSFANALNFDQNGNISFSLNGKKFQFSKDTSLQSMINTINTDEDANVTMKYSRLSDSFTITADSGGENSKVSIINYAGNAFGNNSAFMIDTGIVSNGQNSISEINSITVNRDSNEYTIDGISYTLNSVTAGTDEESIDFSITRDYSSTIDTVSKFVEAFNAMIENLTTIVAADDYSSNYKPLSDSQKEEMSEEEIEAWENKAKNGLLRHDSDLEKLISNLKKAFFSSVGGTGKSTAAIGISTGSYFGSDKGKIILDTDALLSALESNPEEVISMFTGGRSTSEISDQGAIYKIRNSMNDYIGTAKDSVSNTKDKIGSIDEEIDVLEDRLDTLAEKYYEKFSVMETALAKLNSQASYISQLFNS